MLQGGRPFCSSGTRPWKDFVLSRYMDRMKPQTPAMLTKEHYSCLKCTQTGLRPVALVPVAKGKWLAEVDLKETAEAQWGTEHHEWLQRPKSHIITNAFLLDWFKKSGTVTSKVIRGWKSWITHYVNQRNAGEQTVIMPTRKLKIKTNSCTGVTGKSLQAEPGWGFCCPQAVHKWW